VKIASTQEITFCLIKYAMTNSVARMQQEFRKRSREGRHNERRLTPGVSSLKPKGVSTICHVTCGAQFGCL
jgi:hypothetical protein